MHPTSITRGILRTAIVGAAISLLLTLAVPAFAASGWKTAASGTGANLAGVAAPTPGLRWAVGAGGVTSVAAATAAAESSAQASTASPAATSVVHLMWCAPPGVATRAPRPVPAA